MSGRTFLIPREVAERLGINVTRVLGWIRAGQLRATNISNSPTRPRWRIKPADLDAFLESRSNKPAEPEKPSRRRNTHSVKEFV